jgi:hypothetical protein
MIGRKIWKVGDWVMLLAILFSIVVQFNDPDPFAWIAIYGLAAGASVLGLLGRGHWACPAVVGLVAAVWAARIAPRVLSQVPFLAMFDAFEMENAGIEESREMYGLVFIATWMVVLAVRAARAPASVTV